MSRHEFHCHVLDQCRDMSLECRDILLYELLQLCRDIKIHCRDRNQSVYKKLCRDRNQSVYQKLCRDSFHLWLEFSLILVAT